MRLDLIKAYNKEENVYRFKINTNRFKVLFKTSSPKDNKHSSNIGLNMVDGISVLYKHPEKNVWANIEASNKSQVNINLSQSVENNKCYDVMIYSPILTSLEELIIECSDSYNIISDYEENKSVLVLGGQITFGIGCTTAGLMYSNIIGRKFNVNIHRIAFDSECFLEEILKIIKDEKILRAYDLAIIELNSLDNTEILKEILLALNECCKDIVGWYAFNDSAETNLHLESFPDLKVKDVSCIFNKEYKDMCTFDDEHINDAGNIMIYKSLTPLIKEVTKWNI